MPLLLSDEDLNQLQTLLDVALMPAATGARLVGFFQTRHKARAQEIARMAAAATKPQTPAPQQDPATSGQEVLNATPS